MRSSLTALALATGATAQYSSSLLASNPGGAIPAGVQAPSSAGLSNATIQPSRGGLAVCVSGMVSVQASTTKNLKLNLDVPKNQSQVTELFVEDITSGSPFMTEIMGGMQSVNGSYEIGATLCTPANDTKPDQVQILTHGVGFDRYYWDFAPGYSYVDVAAQYNHATFFYDRLGVGKSQKADPLNVIQSPLEVEIANALALKLRQGAFAGCSFKTVIGAGHSFGSIITQAITAQYPSTLDAAILTGFSVNATGMPPFLTGLNLAIASQNQPYRFADLNNAYLVSSSAISNQIGFFRAPGFDPSILAQAEAQKGTVTLGELLTTSAVMATAMNYTHPVAVVNGAEDLPFCLGNCSYPTNKAQAVFPMLYPATNVTGTFLGEVAGHGLNLHYSAVEAYHYIQDFVGKNVK
ncbi:hypothetical protein DOTSEDRAFT_75960 [Dothistroma septosporum NZE10]|uniref:AB hydrolase-1 domain-containing protein n=1 Tax=Dothistroma septosporum (strain NZE10 / CBS 128990) TaxID=675120 RepID=M2YHP8_DOTSN|nr:hypothetical protein DOTSEDRAFT_75960 [Dothistroma septosporum NZE10]